MIFITFKSFDVVFVVLLVKLTCFIHLHTVWIFNTSFNEMCFLPRPGWGFRPLVLRPMVRSAGPTLGHPQAIWNKKWQMPGKEGTGMLATDWANITNWETSIPPVIQRGNKLYLVLVYVQLTLNPMITGILWQSRYLEYKRFKDHTTLYKNWKALPQIGKK